MKREEPSTESRSLALQGTVVFRTSTAAVFGKKMMCWILILSLVSSIGLLVAQNIIYDINTQALLLTVSIGFLAAPSRAWSDLVIYDINTQAKCTEVQRSRTRDCRWGAGLDMTDQIVEGGRIAAYKIQWFNGRWSGWYVPGVNDMDTKFNPYPRTCSLSYRAKSMRRRWSYFYDHTHKFIICKPH